MTKTKLKKKKKRNREAGPQDLIEGTESRSFRAFLRTVKTTGVLDAAESDQLNRWWNSPKGAEKITEACKSFYESHLAPHPLPVSSQGPSGIQAVRKTKRKVVKQTPTALPPELATPELTAQIRRQFEEKHPALVAEIRKVLDPDAKRTSVTLQDLLASDTDADTLAFTRKIIPSFDRDFPTWRDGKTGSVYTEATLAAMNPEGWKGAVLRYWTAGFTPFFIELGKALDTNRELWDPVDEKIFKNWSSRDEFSKPLKDLTHEEASQLLGIPTSGAYAKQLQRLKLKRPGGRPKGSARKPRHKL